MLANHLSKKFKTTYSNDEAIASNLKMVTVELRGMLKAIGGGGQRPSEGKEWNKSSSEPSNYESRSNRLLLKNFWSQLPLASRYELVFNSQYYDLETYIQ